VGGWMRRQMQIGFFFMNIISECRAKVLTMGARGK
jgi:hypothetical protein